MLILKTVDRHMKAFRGFVWPESGPVSCPDWDPRPVCGGGLHGLPWGEGDGSLLNWSADARWLVFEADDSTSVVFDGKCKVPSATVVYCGDRLGAAQYIAQHGGAGRAIVGGTATAGLYGTATAGMYGTATAGDDGTATAGDGGTATAGDGGTATAGLRGTATAGDDGTVIIKHWNGTRHEFVVGYVGLDAVRANVAYRLDDAGNFVRAK